MNRLNLLLLLTLIGTSLAFGIPQRLNYQGFTTRTDGSPLDTTVSMTFRIYDSLVGGTTLWSETHGSIVITDGLFQATLGSVTALSDIFSANRYLGITIGGDTEMNPRQHLTSVAHAFRVATVDGASGGAVSGDVAITGKANIGVSNSNSGNYAFVAGQLDSATGTRATVPGGYSNTASGDYSVVGGGRDNLADNSYSTVSGGYSNEATGFGSATSGYNNSVTGSYGTIGGGSGNTNSSLYSVIGGGRDNAGAGHYAVIGGGYGNAVGDSVSTIAGGRDNTIDSSYSFIGGGRLNHTVERHSTIAGGYNNSADGGAFIGGGSTNRAEWYAVVGGGASNIAGSADVVIGGGYQNEIDLNGYYSVIGGGEANYLTGNHSVLGGGEHNKIYADYAVVSGGGGPDPLDSNSAAGDYSTVPGGRRNLAQGDYSFAAGRRARAENGGAFVWADQTNADFASTASNQFNVRSAGGVRIFTNADADWGVALDAGDNTWNSVCDSTRKTKLGRVDGAEILRRLNDVPIFRWHQRTGDPGVQHIGPMAQDFWSAFHVGSDSLKISTIDPDGVTIAAIQELTRRTERIVELERELAELRAQLHTLLTTSNNR